MEYSIPAIERLLRNYPFISEDIDKLKKELQWNIDLKKDLLEIHAMAPRETPSSLEVSDPTYDAFIVIDKIQKEIDRLFNRIITLFDNQLTVKVLLGKLSRDERYVIESRYFQREAIPWTKIAFTLHCDRTTCNRIKLRALFKMARLI